MKRLTVLLSLAVFLVAASAYAQMAPSGKGKPSPKSPTVFVDDFSDGDLLGWYIDEGNWTVQDGRLVIRRVDQYDVSDYKLILVDNLDTTISLIRNSVGRAIGFRGIGRDRTDVLLTRRALEESEDKYRTILESIEDGYFEVDLKGNFVFSNESMCKILGYPSQELKGMNNRQFMSEETSKKVFETINKVYKAGEPTKALGWDLIRKDGEKRYVETSISLMRDPKGEPAGYRGIARDITERKRLEKAKERAINHLSHELRTPLSIIQWMIKRFPGELKKGNMERIQEWIERMNRNLIRLRDLQTKIDDILNERPGQERERILNLVEAAIAFLDELKDEPLKESAEVIRQKIIKRLDSLHKVEEVQKETIALDAFIRQICQEARLSMRGRSLEIV